MPCCMVKTYLRHLARSAALAISMCWPRSNGPSSRPRPPFRSFSSGPH